MKRFFIYIFFFLNIVYSQNNVKIRNNFEILRDLYSGISLKISSIIPEQYKNIYIKITGNENNFIVENFIKENLFKEKNITQSFSDSIYKLNIIHSTGICYNIYPEDNDKFIRNIKCMVTVRISGPGIEVPKSIIENYSDTLAFSNLKSIEYKLLDVNKQGISEKSILNQILEPLVILGGVGIMIYMLFSQRSN